MKGAIIVNGYFSNDATTYQTERLVYEFNKLGVKINVIKSNEIITAIKDGNAYIKHNLLDGVNFIVYLNKDRYQAELLQSLGYIIFNNYDAIVNCDDKMLTFVKLANKGINMPYTISSPIMYSDNDDVAFLDNVEKSLGYPVIVKNVYGSMGKTVYKADNRGELDELFKQLKMTPHVYQQAIKPLGKDTRVIVVGGKVVGAISRSSKTDFRSNVELGGTATAVTISEEVKNLCEKVANILELDYAGIDVLSDGVKNYVCEVNSNAFFTGMEKSTGINIASLYAKHILSKL